MQKRTSETEVDLVARNTQTKSETRHVNNRTYLRKSERLSSDNRASSCVRWYPGKQVDSQVGRDGRTPFVTKHCTCCHTTWRALMAFKSFSRCCQTARGCRDTSRDACDIRVTRENVRLPGSNLLAFDGAAQCRHVSCCRDSRWILPIRPSSAALGRARPPSAPLGPPRPRPPALASRARSPRWRKSRNYDLRGSRGLFARSPSEPTHRWRDSDV